MKGVENLIVGFVAMSFGLANYQSTMLDAITVSLAIMNFVLYLKPIKE